ncbi:MAG: pyridoxamine 5'-phosphate oxidase family protein [Helicobacter sp.]|uniref:pyridoxamine 5'-phosphate oxidase family protein n=1 Tax=Helicobacter sp. TaxID=218 RepID=UPI00375186F7|nr:pyridoxamine 5'-phosphate oxidase family protein [Helicobacter sp.]
MENHTILKEIEAFRDSFNSVVLATLSQDSMPCLSYSPLLRYEGGYYLYISEVAKHFENLQMHPKSAQVMFIEDESKANILLAHTRLIYDVHVEFLPRDAFFDAVYDSFESRVGKDGGVCVVRGMQDFHLLKLHLQKGRFVKGFGQAYDIDERGEIAHIGGKGHPPHKA